MSKSKWEKAAEDLHRRLEDEKTAHARTRNELQREVSRWQRLASPKILDLMGTYQPLRKLLHVLAEAAELQDPLRGAPTEDTMRTEVTELTQTERSVLTYSRHRQNVRLFGKELEHLREDFERKLADKAHRFAQTVGATEWQYPEVSKCADCGAYVFQPPTGRPRKYCEECSPRKTLENSRSA